jgi:hypothetical protein
MAGCEALGLNFEPLRQYLIGSRISLGDDPDVGIAS